MALYIGSDELADGTNALKTAAGGMATKVVHGDECSIVVAVREGGYHSKPHYHESEQLTYVMDGEMWVFVEEEGFLVKAGDFFRIPVNAVHWGYNRSAEPITTFQVHSPALDPTRDNVSGLYLEGEEPAVRGNSLNIPTDDERYILAEERVLAEADAKVS